MAVAVSTPAFCDKCSRAIGAKRAPVVVLGVDDKRGLMLPAELQERIFCTPNCFWRWFYEHRPADINADPDPEFEL